MLSNFTMSEIINYFVEVVAADEVARRDFKSLHESSYQLFKAGQIDLKAKQFQFQFEDAQCYAYFDCNPYIF